MSTSSEAYFSVAVVEVNPDKIDQVITCFEEIVKATMEREAGAKIYRFFRTQGKNEFVWISKFESRKAYDAHLNSAHVQEWLKKYPDNPKDSDLYVGDWVFRDMSKEMSSGGFERP